MSTNGSELGSADRRHLNAAEGWAGLGDWKQANAEIELISPASRAHPEVLQMRFVMSAHAQTWDVCLEIGQAQLDVGPNMPFGWINRSYALRRLPGGGVQSAYDALLPATERLKNSEAILFNLACYASQLGKLGQAREWLNKCFAEAKCHSRAKKWRLKALGESDLEPLWRELKENG